MNTGSRLDISREHAEDVEIIGLRGELDLTTAERLLEAVGGSSAPNVVLDLTALLFIDSAGVRAIDSEHARLERVGRALLIVAPHESRAAWTFRIAGFSDEFVLDSVDAARERIASASSS